MRCSCSDHHHNQEHARKVQDLLGSVGLNEIVEQGHEAIAEAGRALDQLNRSERARSLGFGREVIDIHGDAAKRSNQRAREQVQAVLARIDDRLQQSDWQANVDRVRAAFKERGGTTKLADLREDIRLRLLNDDTGISATVAERSLAVLDSAIKAASKDLNEVAGHLRGIMDYALHGFEPPEMGRQPVGLELPDGPRGKTKQRPIRGGRAVNGWCVALYACIAWACSSLIVSMIICFAVPFCWCCFHLILLGAFALHMASCSLAFNNACQQGGP